jgi:hypothetical protein
MYGLGGHYTQGRQPFGATTATSKGLAGMSIEPQVHPVTALGLPEYSAASLSDDETRLVYIHGELLMRKRHNELAGEGMAVEEQAKTMFALRCALRTWTRTLMSNTAMAEWLEANERNPTFDQLVALHERRGLTGDTVYIAIITSSTRSRPSVNAQNGVDPDNPPPLPPVR